MIVKNCHGSCRIEGVVYVYDCELMKTVVRVYARQVGNALPTVYRVSIKRSEIKTEKTGFALIDERNELKEAIRLALLK